MPGPNYTRKNETSGIDLLRGTVKAFGGSLERANSDSHELRKQNVQKTSETYAKQLFKRLGDKSSGYDERAQSAVEVKQVLDELESESIAALWYSAHDLIDPHVPQPARRIALELLLECIKKCEGVSLEVVFLHIVTDSFIAITENEKTAKLDPDMDLFMSCLNECIRGTKGILDTDETAVLKGLTEELISLELSHKSKDMPSAVILELLKVISNLDEPPEKRSSLALGELLKFTTDVHHNRDEKFLIGTIDFLAYLIGKRADIISPLIRDMAVILRNISMQTSEDMAFPQMRALLRQIANSTINQDFLEQVYELAFKENANSDKMIQLYTTSFISTLHSKMNSADTAIQEGQILFLLNRLHFMKKDMILLNLIGQLIQAISLFKVSDVSSKFWISTASSTELGLWPLIKAVCTRNSENKRINRSHVINELLLALLKKDSRIPVPPDEAVKFVCGQKMQVNAANLIHLVDVRRLDIHDIDTLYDLLDFILSPSVSWELRLKLFNLITSSLKDNNLSPLLNKECQQTLISRIYSKIEMLEMNDAEMVAFGDLLYEFSKILPIKAFTMLVSDLVIPDIQNILVSKKRRKSFVGAIGNFGRGYPVKQFHFKKLDLLVNWLVKTFIWSATDTSDKKCVILYDALISAYEFAENCKNTVTLLTVARAMVRIRRDLGGHFYLSNPIDAVGISSALGRHKEQVNQKTDKIQWTFPETIDIIDDSLLGNRNVHVQFTTTDDDIDDQINMASWLSLAINTIEAPIDWEIYSYLLTHVCPQLSEITLFQCHHNLIDRFKNVICHHLIHAIPSAVKLRDGISSSDLHSAYVRNLSAVLAYHPYEPKSFADELVNALVFGLTSWEKTLIPILHILTVSCFEVSMSVQRYLTPILLHIQKRITSLYAIPSILEFLLALRTSPRLISNLTIEEIKRVFAIVFKLIENSIDLKIRSKMGSPAHTTASIKSQTHSPAEYEIEISPSTEAFLIGEKMAAFFQYQSFRVLSYWFLSMNPSRKMNLTPFIVKNLEKLQHIDDLRYDSLAYMDFIFRSRFFHQKNGVSANDIEDTADDEKLGRWIQGDSLISVRTRPSLEKAIVKIRNPSCNWKFEMQPPIKTAGQKTYNIFGFDVCEEFDNVESEMITSLQPEDFMLQLQYIQQPIAKVGYPLMKIPDDPAFNRSIGILDRIPEVEFQKTGIIYIGTGQDTETDVLSNAVGSYQYHWFLKEMGDFIKLSEVPKFFCTGGLESGIDGEYALIWSDEITQITFHTVTLMPSDEELSLKKRHVGNNFVNIFYDESGLRNFKFNLIKSQFTFMSIVIIPQTASPGNRISEHYKIKLYRRTGTPGLLSCAHFKILQRVNLARYVRHVSLVANALAQKYHENHTPDACSIWGIRCKHLTALRERVIAATEDHSPK